MLLHRIHLNPRCKDARRDLADPYQMHATLCRAFFPEGIRCPQGALLWRLEPETDAQGRSRVLIQSQVVPDWSRLPPDWLAPALSDSGIPVNPGIDLAERLSLDTLAAGQTFRFRLRANPCKTTQGKRVGLVRPDAQRAWLARKGEQHGFALPASDTPDYFDFIESPEGQPYPDVRVSQDQMLVGRRHDDTTIRVFSVLFEGRLTVRDPAKFFAALKSGIGHGKVMGLGLLSVAPVSR
jgi:CRISPR system Cascade subunit CasE